MESDWRDQLQEQIRKIRESDRPVSKVETIVIPTELNESDLSKFVAFTGWHNDREFGAAPAGSLEIRSAARWGGPERPADVPLPPRNRTPLPPDESGG